MMMKRWICFVAGTILAAGMMAGCGSSGNEQEQGMSQAAADMAKAGAPGTEGTVTISYGCWDSNQGELFLPGDPHMDRHSFLTQQHNCFAQW